VNQLSQPDVRERTAYNDPTWGAMTMPMDFLVDMAKASIALSRDIYIYGETDEETASAAQQLRLPGLSI